jgi:1-acyl-sn-glycerol-3-phosphate acyltransferase
MSEVGGRVMRLLRTLQNLASFHLSLLAFAVTCLSWSVVALPLYLVLPQRAGARIGRLGISRGFRIYARFLTGVRAYRLDLGAIDALRDGPGLILAANHPSMIDAILIVTRHPNVICVMKPELMNNVLLGSGARLARYIRSRPPRQMLRESVEVLRRGGVLLLFPEGTRTVRAPVNAFVASAGLIAKHAQVPVQTLIVETDSPFLSKGWPPFRRPALPITYRVRLGKRFDPAPDPRALDRALETYFREQLAESLQNAWLGAGTKRQNAD